MKWYLLFFCSICMVLVGGCEDQSGVPVNESTNSALLVNNGTPAKILITVELSPSPEGGVEPEATASPSPTDFPEPVDPTDTPTPYVGSFIGASVDGTPNSAAISPINGSSASVGISVPGGGSGFPTAVAGNCSVTVAAAFTSAYAANQSALQQLGCPVDGGVNTNLVFQPFERGKMFWRDTRQIYVLQPNNNLLVLTDTWQEGQQPESDPAFAPPSGNLQQPIRGFGYVWRNNEGIRSAIGYATQSESVLPGFWQTFSNGAMFVGDNGSIYALVLNDTGNGVYYGSLTG